MVLPMSFHKVTEYVQHQFAPVLYAETEEEPIEMRAHRWNRNTQFPGDLLVGMTLEELLNDRRLAARQ